MRRRLRAAGVVAAVVALVLVAAAFVFVSAPIVVSIPTQDGTVGCNLLELEGSIHGDRWREPHVWLDSSADHRLVIEWPHGYKARFDPQLELLNASGRVVAREGDYLYLTGDASAGGIATVCVPETWD